MPPTGETFPVNLAIMAINLLLTDAVAAMILVLRSPE